jgi:hypothetical protein
MGREKEDEDEEEARRRFGNISGYKPLETALAGQCPEVVRPECGEGVQNEYFP